eukprot:3070803-Alexandrium_andersonii.AAC.1
MLRPAYQARVSCWSDLRGGLRPLPPPATAFPACARPRAFRPAPFPVASSRALQRSPMAARGRAGYPGRGAPPR